MQQFNYSIVNVVIFAMLISLIMSCGDDEDPKIISPNHLPIAVGNTWNFIDPEYPDDSGYHLLSQGQQSCPMAKLYSLPQQQMNMEMMIEVICPGLLMTYYCSIKR